jgi:hypothetical protein
VAYERTSAAARRRFSDRISPNSAMLVIPQTVGDARLAIRCCSMRMSIFVEGRGMFQGTLVQGAYPGPVGHMAIPRRSPLPGSVPPRTVLHRT